VTGKKRTVSLVVLTCGAPTVTARCLRSVAALRGVQLQLIVVNNGGGCSVGTAVESFAHRWRDHLADIQILTNDHNVGACSGRNQALERADGRWVAFLDNDIVWQDPEWLTGAVGLLDADPKVGILGPRLLEGRDPSRLECAGYAVSPRGRFVALGCGARREERVWTVRRSVQGVGNFVTRKKTMRAIGGFDTAFDPFGFENIDCCYRVKQLGLGVVCDGQADLHHCGHMTTSGFENGGKTVLLEKSLLLRRRWSSAFAQEERLYGQLTHISPLSCSSESS